MITFAAYLLASCSICSTSEEPASASEATRPYRVSVLLAIEPTPAIPSATAAELIADLRRAVDRTLGNCWKSDIRLGDPSPAHEPLELESLPKGEEFEKFLLVRIRARPDAVSPTAIAREYDQLLRAWGPERSTFVQLDRNLPLQILRLCLQVFRPTAEILGKERGRVSLSVRGSALLPETGGLSLLSDGEPLSILRIREASQEDPETVPWSYLVVRSKGSRSGRFGAEAEVVSIFRDPLTRRSRQKIRLAAVACRVGDDARSVVEFRTRPEKRPIVGYEVVARPVGQSGFVSLGSTDYSGNVSISLSDVVGRKSNAAQVVDVLLLSGELVLARFPIVPGDRPYVLAETSIDPLLPEFAGKIIAFQESVVDLAARRKILELRYKMSAEKSDLDAMKQIVARINALPDREQFRQELATLEISAKNRSEEMGQRSLGPNLRRMFLQSATLLERSVPQGKYELQTTESPAEPAAPAPATP